MAAGAGVSPGSGAGARGRGSGARLAGAEGPRSGRARLRAPDALARAVPGGCGEGEPVPRRARGALGDVAAGGPWDHLAGGAAGRARDTVAVRSLGGARDAAEVVHGQLVAPVHLRASTRGQGGGIRRRAGEERAKEGASTQRWRFFFLGKQVSAGAINGTQREGSIKFHVHEGGSSHLSHVRGASKHCMQDVKSLSKAALHARCRSQRYQCVKITIVIAIQMRAFLSVITVTMSTTAVMKATKPSPKHAAAPPPPGPLSFLYFSFGPGMQTLKAPC